MVSLLDIIGPVMVGPSSSHTAGACRLGLLVGGLLGFRPDDERLRDALMIAEREGLDYKFEKTTIADAAHPNTVRISVELDGNKATMLGSSLGACRILVQEIDGFP